MLTHQKLLRSVFKYRLEKIYCNSLPAMASLDRGHLFRLWDLGKDWCAVTQTEPQRKDCCWQSLKTYWEGRLKVKTQPWSVLQASVVKQMGAQLPWRILPQIWSMNINWKFIGAILIKGTWACFFNV